VRRITTSDIAISELGIMSNESTTSSQTISSVLNEQRLFPPPRKFTEAARIKAADLAALQRRADADPVGYWADLARAEIAWRKLFTQTLDESAAPNYRWFADGELNVSWNCLDVHLAEHGHRTAIIFEGEPGDVCELSYRQLHAEVCRFANALKARGVRRGDRVVIYMPLVPEAVVAMQACARIGAIHSVVFGGFSALSLKDRIEDAGARCVITADGGRRGGNIVELKTATDKALAEGCASVETVFVLRRTGEAVAMQAGRDVWWHDAIVDQPAACEPEWVDAEHPLFLLYTSGSTGRPKGIQHASAGYLLNAKLTNRWVFDLHHDDVFWCTADVGWITGHSYVAYGPLAAGATIVMYEGAPTYPDGARFWRMCEQHGVTIFYTAPTAIRALMKLGEELPARHDLSKLRLLGSVGEPINPEAWMWYHRVIGKERCPIVDTWWQTETGAILISPIPGVTATKPGSCTRPLPGIFADIVDDEGRSVTTPGAGGYLVIRKPWPSMLRTIWGDNERYLKTYWEKFHNRFYVASPAIDSARWKSSPHLSRIRASRKPRSSDDSTRSRASRCLLSWCVAAPVRPATLATSSANFASGWPSNWVPSPSLMTSASPTICQRRGQARSCVVCCVRSRVASRSRRMCRPSRIRPSSSSCAVNPDLARGSMSLRVLRIGNTQRRARTFFAELGLRCCNAWRIRPQRRRLNDDQKDCAERATRFRGGSYGSWRTYRFRPIRIGQSRQRSCPAGSGGHRPQA